MAIVPTIILGFGRTGAQVLERVNFLLGSAAAKVAAYTVSAALGNGPPRLVLGNEDAQEAVRVLTSGGTVDPRKLLKALVGVHQGNMPGTLEIMRSRVLCLTVAELGEAGAFAAAQTHIRMVREICEGSFTPETHVFQVGVFLALKKDFGDYDPQVFEALKALQTDQSQDGPGLFSRIYLLCDQYTECTGDGNYSARPAEMINSAAAFAAFMASPVEFLSKDGVTLAQANPRLDDVRLCQRTPDSVTLSTIGARGFIFPGAWIKRYCARKLAGQAIRERIMWVNSGAVPQPPHGPLELDEALMQEDQGRLDVEALRFLAQDPKNFEDGFTPEEVGEYINKLPPDRFTEQNVDGLIDKFIHKISGRELLRRAGLRGLPDRLKAIDAAFGHFHVGELAREKERATEKVKARFTEKLTGAVDEVMRERGRSFFNTTFFLRLLGLRIKSFQQQDQEKPAAPIPDPAPYDARVEQAIRKTPHWLPFLSAYAMLGLAICYIVYHVPVLLDRLGWEIDLWTWVSSKYIFAPLILVACLGLGWSRLWLAHRRLEVAVQQYLKLLHDKYTAIDANNQRNALRHFYKFAQDEILRHQQEVCRCREHLRPALEPWPVPRPRHPNWSFFEFLVPATRADYEHYYPKMNESDWREFDGLLFGPEGFFKDWRAMARGDRGAIALAKAHLERVTGQSRFLNHIDTVGAEDRMEEEKGLAQYVIPYQKLFRLLRHSGRLDERNYQPFCISGKDKQSHLALALDRGYVLRECGIREMVCYYWIEVDIPFERVLLCKGLSEPAKAAKPAKETE